MGTVTGYTAERMKQIEDASVVNGELDAFGHLILTRFDESTIDAGIVTTSPKIATSGTRPTGGALYEGLQIFETDTDRLLIWDGTYWRDKGNGKIICTAATRPANPTDGMEIYETDTDRTYVYVNSAWYLTSVTNPVVARLWHSAPQAIANSTVTPLIFDTEISDPYGMHSGSGSGLTIPAGADGFYLMGANTGWASNNTGARRMAIKVGATGVATLDIPASGDSNMAITTAYPCSAGQVVTVEVAQFAGGPLNAIGHSFWVARVG